MVTIKKALQTDMPAVEEGWWESVLAEQGRHSLAAPQPVARAGKKLAWPPKPAPDWEHVQQLYREDCIVSLKI